MATVEERLLDKVNMRGQDECWPWTASSTVEGYGRLNVRGEVEYAHRIVVRLSGGKINGKVVRHTCDNPACCNPAHLRIGTHADNIADRDSKGRGRWPGNQGSRNGTARFTEGEVEQMRAVMRFLPRHPSGRVLNGWWARFLVAYRMGHGHAKNIRSGRLWSHVGGAA